MKQGKTFADLALGMQVSIQNTVKEQDVVDFARVSGDHNPLHMDEDYARTTQFKGRIAHGALTASYISAILGNDLPGPGAVYLSQKLDFKRPIRPGDEVTIKVVLTALEPPRAILSTQIRVNGKLAVDGEAVAALPMSRS